MVDTFTANYELTQPEVGASDNTWGEKHNANMDAIDAQMKANADAVTAASAKGVPAGGILVWSGAVASVPSGWALCDGNNSTPDLRDRFIIGAQGAHAIGATGGSDTTSSGGAHDHSMQSAGSHNHGGSTTSHAVTVAEMPGHNHGGGSHAHSAYRRDLSGTSSDSSPFAFTANNYGSGAAATQSSGTLLTAQGGGAGHDHSISSAGGHDHTVNSSGAHTHTLTPSYYALALIMKL